MEGRHAFSALLVGCVLVAIAAGMYFTAGREEEKSVKAYFFYSDYCPHCAEVKPLVNASAEKLNVVYCCVDEALSEECYRVAKENGVYVVPVLVVYENGKKTVLEGSTEIEIFLTKSIRASPFRAE